MPTNLNIIQTVCIGSDKVLLNNQVWIENTSASPFSVFGKNIYQQLELSYAKFFKMDLLARLGFLSAELLTQNDILQNHAPEMVAQVLSNAASTLDIDIKYTESMESIPSPAQFVYTLPNIMMGEIAIRHGIRGENIFFVSEKPDAAMLHFAVSDLFEKETTSLCFTGWVELLNNNNYMAKMMLVSKDDKQNAEKKPFTIDSLNNFLQ